MEEEREIGHHWGLLELGPTSVISAATAEDDNLTVSAATADDYHLMIIIWNIQYCLQRELQATLL